MDNLDVLTVVAILLFQAILIIFLAVVSERLRHQARQMKEQLRVEGILSSLANDFMRTPGETLDQQIEHGLHTITTILEADSAALFILPDSSSQPDTQLVYYKVGETCPANQAGPFNPLELPQVMATLRSGQTYRFDRLQALPEDASAEREHFTRLGIIANLTLPLLIIDHLSGILSLCRCSSQGAWSETDEQHARLAADLFTSALSRRHHEQILRESEKRYYQLFEGAPDAILLSDADSGVILDANQLAVELIGRPVEQLRGQHVSLLFPPETAARSLELFQRRAQGEGRLSPDEITLNRPDGQLVLVEITNNLFTFRGQHSIHSIFRDITARKQVEAQLRQERDFSDSMIETAPVIIMVLDPQGRIIRYNPYLEQISGYPKEALQDQDWFHLFVAPNVQDKLRAEFQQIEGRYDLQGAVLPMITRQGNHLLIEWYSKTMTNAEGQAIGVLAIGLDVTERRAALAQLKESLADKDVLLKEIHHRVKNNMQVMISLLAMQSLSVSDPVIKAMFIESQNRIRSMALVHEGLYTSTNLASIDFGEYVKRLAYQLFSAYNLNPGVDLHINAETIALSIDQAVPCGMILNEMVTNAIRHAFPGNRNGNVTISLKRVADCVEMCVQDDGIGLPPGLNLQTASSLGMYLIDLLSTQLQGDLHVERQDGTIFRLRFPLSS